MGTAPTVFLGLRMITTTFVYDDDSEHPDRPTSTIATPAWTPEDRALLMGLEMYESTLCRCGYPRSVAWHSEMDGWFGDNGEAEKYVCHACSAIHGRQVHYPIAMNTRTEAHGPLPPFVLGETTTPAD
ncbi:hypothetical protein [Nocardioides sp. SYSU DS0663]|uniref:hypothetical protein n=1 Tax=Nocardioides sp. SYSU DS0663 TaxID=3416445 RepID=UPI003F4BF44D